MAFLAITQLYPCLSPISILDQAFFERGDMGVAEDVLLEYMVLLPTLLPGMTVPPPRPPESLHVRVGNLVHGPQGTTGYLRPKSYGLVSEDPRSWPFVNTVLLCLTLARFRCRLTLWACVVRATIPGVRHCPTLPTLLSRWVYLDFLLLTNASPRFDVTRIYYRLITERGHT